MGISITKKPVVYLDEDAQDAVGGILDDGTVGEIVFTYDDATPLISATVQDAEVDHNSLANTHDLTTDIDHDTITNTHNLTTDISHDSIADVSANDHHTPTASGDIDHDATVNTHNLTTDIDHATITNTHNLTTDINHDALTNFTATEHFTMLDEDNMTSDSNTQAATQQSIKAYVDAQAGPLTQEEVEDYAGAMVENATGTHTGVAITYQDATGDMDFVVDHDAAINFTATEHFTMLDEDNFASNSNTQAATQQSIKAYVDGLTVHQASSAQTDGTDTTTSTSYDDILNMSVTMTTGANPVLILFTGFSNCSEVHSQHYIINIDAGVQGETLRASATQGNECISIAFLTTLTAAEHIIKVQFRVVVSGTVTIENPCLQVIELKQ